MVYLKNWEKNTWLSSKEYINQFSNFLISNFKINKNTRILDIGCGRANIISHLHEKIKFISKPIGIDIYKNNNLKKNIIFKQINGMTFLKRSNDKFDMILIKQTIHFFELKYLHILLNLAKKKLLQDGKILIFLLNSNENGIPVFNKMEKKLKSSLKRDNKIIKKIKINFKKYWSTKFTFHVNISKKQYIEMIRQKYISCLMDLQKKEIEQGIIEIEEKYKNNLRFKDVLDCFVYKA